MTLTNLLEFQLLTYKNFDVTIYEVGQVLFILGVTRLLTFLIRTALNRAVLRRRIERGSAYALGQIITYVVWTLSGLFTLDFIGVQITVILASSTALFVGLGLGLQDTFKDFIAGIVLLECGLANPNVIQDPGPSVQFRDFGSSALVFRLYFFTTQLFLIEFVKSDLRFAIDEAFRKHGITIAFPQMDVWIKEAPKS